MARIRVGSEELEFVSKNDGIIELEQGQEIPAAIFADELGRVKFRDRDSVSVFMSTLAALGGNVKQIDAAAGPPSGVLPPEVVVYIDLDTLRLYKRTESGWGTGLNLRGETGQQGQQGERGKTIIYGSENPNTRIDLDNYLVGDMYAETGPDNNPEHQLWAKTQPAFAENGSRLLQWERIGRPYGRIPEDGAPGQRGRSIFEGTSNPNTPVGLDVVEVASAIDGDLYIETDRFIVWKKIGGVWHERGQSFKGSNGQDGASGARGNSVYEGTLDPNSLEMQSELSNSLVGDVYINTATYVVWKKKRLTGVQWDASGTTFKGTDGTSGNTIFQGAGIPNLESTPKPAGFNNAKFGDVYLDTITHKIWKYTSEDPEAHWTTVGEPYKGVGIIQGKGDPNYLALLETEPPNDLLYSDKQYDWFQVRNSNIGDAYFDVDGHDLWKKVIDIENYDETNPLLNKIWVKKGQSLTGPPAETLVLESTSYFVGYDKEGKNPSPQSFTLTANVRNYPESGITYKFGTLTKDVSGNIIKTQVDEEEDVNSIDINLMDAETSGDDLTQFFGNPPAPKTYYVDVYVNDEFKASDTITVLGVREGSNAVNVILSNETHVFPSDTDGNINPDVYFLGATDVYAYVGAEILDPKTEVDYATSNNCFKVKIKSLNGIKASNQPTNSLATSITAGQFLSNIESMGGGNSKLICFPFDWTSETKSASIVYEIYIKTSFAAGEIILEKTQSFARLNDGNRGKSSLQGTGDPNLISRITDPFNKISWATYSNLAYGVPTSEAERDYEEVVNANVGDKYIDLSTSLTYVKLESSWQQNQIGLLSNVEKKGQSAFSVYRSFIARNFGTVTVEGILNDLAWWAGSTNCSFNFKDGPNITEEDYYTISTVGISPSNIGSNAECFINTEVVNTSSLWALYALTTVLDTNSAERMRIKLRRTPGVVTEPENYSWIGRFEFLYLDSTTNQYNEQFKSVGYINHNNQSVRVINDPTIDKNNEWVVVEWDLSKNTIWKNKTIIGMRLVLFDKPNNSVDIEWIAFGNSTFSPLHGYESIRLNSKTKGKGWIVPSHDIGYFYRHSDGNYYEANSNQYNDKLLATRTLTSSPTAFTPGVPVDGYIGVQHTGITIDTSNNISGVGTITNTGGIELGKGYNNYAHIDFTTVSSQTDYNARIIRDLTANGGFTIANVGTGGISFYQESAGDINFYTNNISRMSVNGLNGQVTIANAAAINSTLSVAGYASLNGGVKLGNASDDTITVNGRLAVINDADLGGVSSTIDIPGKLRIGTTETNGPAKFDCRGDRIGIDTANYIAQFVNKDTTVLSDGVNVNHAVLKLACGKIFADGNAYNEEFFLACFGNDTGGGGGDFKAAIDGDGSYINSFTGQHYSIIESSNLGIDIEDEIEEGCIVESTGKVWLDSKNDVLITTKPCNSNFSKKVYGVYSKLKEYEKELHYWRGINFLVNKKSMPKNSIEDIVGTFEKNGIVTFSENILDRFNENQYISQENGSFWFKVSKILDEKTLMLHEKESIKFPTGKSKVRKLLSHGSDPTYGYSEDSNLFKCSIKSLGEGKIFVTTYNGEPNNGDYVCSSEVCVSGKSGYAQLQNDDILRSSTVAKISEEIDWSSVIDTFEYNGKIYKKKLVACTYHCG